ncbi:AraC family transcriptional regulator [Tissierella praeacuta]|uniref:AraC family transcriptional regulator n=1 Tax=Tissierella praeacuta TaxID=43131 RepID=UPI00334127FE
MKTDINRLAEYFTYTHFNVEGVYHYSVDSGESGWMKTAPFPGFIFPIRGQAQFHFDGSPYLANVGNIIHGGANMSLDKRVIGNIKWEYFLVLYNIHSSDIKDFTLENTHFQLDIGQSPRLSEMIRRLWKISSQPGTIYAFQRETIFHCILEEIFTCAYNQTNGDAQLLFTKASEYIHQHYMDIFTIGELADLYEVNENRLFYVFTKYTGMGPGDYLMIHRLNRAKELLITGDAPIIMVAKSVGYSSPYHFSRAFKKQFGISPSGFREKFRNNA